MRDVLCQVQLCSRLLFPGELHHEVLIPRLTLLDWNAQTHLIKSQTGSGPETANRLTMNNTCKSSFGNKNSLCIVE